MKELYKVHKIKISLLDETSLEAKTEIASEFGVLVEREGILYLVTHIFEQDDFSLFNYETLGCRASAQMFTFNDIEIETSWMVFTEMTTDESTVTFKCHNYATIKEEDGYYAHQKSIGFEMPYSQLLKIEFWGIDLLVNKYTNTSIMVADAPFEIQLSKDFEKGIICASFPVNNEVSHNTLTVELYERFRSSLIGYLSLVNGARVQISKEYYNGFSRIYSYNKVENIAKSTYACGNAKIFRPCPILFEFDNYVRWNEVIDLNKFVHHLCTAEQVLNYEDRSFILILAFEGLCKHYCKLQEDKISKKVISDEIFEQIKEDFFDVLNKHAEIDSVSQEKLRDNICRLNDIGLATYKFRLILEDLNIKRTKDINLLLKSVRSTLVHEAKLNNYKDYVLLSELIREIILRLIDSKIQRYSRFTEKMFLGDPPNLSYVKYIKEKTINTNVQPIFSEFDNCVKLRKNEES